MSVEWYELIPMQNPNGLNNVFWSWQRCWDISYVSYVLNYLRPCEGIEFISQWCHINVMASEVTCNSTICSKASLGWSFERGIYHSLSCDIPYKIFWSVEVARFRMFQLFWNLLGGWLSIFNAIWWFLHPLSPLLNFERSYNNTSIHLVNYRNVAIYTSIMRVDVPILLSIIAELTEVQTNWNVMETK